MERNARALLLISKELLLNKEIRSSVFYHDNEKYYHDLYNNISRKSDEFTVTGVLEIGNATPVKYAEYSKEEFESLPHDTIIGLTIPIKEAEDLADFICFNDYYSMLNRTIDMTFEEYIKENVWENKERLLKYGNVCNFVTSSKVLDRDYKIVNLNKILD